MTAYPTQSDTLSLSPGDQLDGYTIGRLVGQGGTSAVWEAVATESDTRVAVKQLLFTGGADDDMLARRFRKEAKLLEQLSQTHPRIVKIIDFIDDQRGAFLVMEFIDGQSLEALLNESGDPIDPLRALKIVHAVANVLVAVHGQGVVHRDLKPSNLLLPDQGGVKVCDLGLAGFIAEQEALPVGSVRYMAPELFVGESATGKADIYALGMIAYEMFAGRAAFNEVFKTVLRDQRNQSVRWMKWHTNLRVGVPPLHEVNPKIPQRLSDLVARMMDKDLDRRVASAEELAEAIGRHFNKNRPPDRTGGKQQRKAPPAAPNAVEKTAQLKKKRKWPMYLALIAVIAASCTGIYLALDKQAKEEAAVAAVVGKAVALLQTGDAKYLEGEFAEALAAFTEASKLDQQMLEPRQRDRIEAGMLLNAARLALAEDDLPRAREGLEKLDRMNPPNNPIYPHDTVQDLRDEVERRQNVARDIAAIGTLIDEGKLPQAQAALADYRGRLLRDEEAAALGALSLRISAGKSQAYADQALATAADLAQTGDLAKAIRSLEAALKQHSTPAMQDQLDAYKLQQRVTGLRQRAEKADASDGFANAIDAYNQLQALVPEDAYEAALNDLKARRAVSQGRALLDDGDSIGAKAKFVEALGFADNAEARGYLARLESAADWQALVAAGDKAFGDSDYAAAARHYSEALRLDADDKLRGKLTRARVHQELAKAEQAFAAGDMDRAKAAYSAAMALDADAPGAAEGLKTIDARERYDAEIDRGDKLRGEGRFALARAAYTRAQQIIDTPEARQRLDDTEYEALLGQAKAYIELEQWSAAHASLVAAGRVNPTDEVRGLLNTVVPQLPRDDPETKP